MEQKAEIKVCRLSCNFLRYSLTWPNKHQEFNPSKWFYIRQLIFVVLFTIPNGTLLLMHLILSLQEGTVDISEDLAFFSSILGLLIMMAIYVIKQKLLATLLRDLSDFRVYGKPPFFDTVIKQLEYFVKFIFFYAAFGAIVYNGIKIINIPTCKEFQKIRETCGVLIPCWAPFSADDWFIDISLIVYVFVFSITLDRTELFVALQAFEIACNIKLRIDQLNSMLLRCFDHPNLAWRRLTECVRYHNLLINYCERFNNCFTYEMFMFLVMTGTICACLENQIIQQHNIGAILHIFGWIGSLFLACVSGQILIDSSTSIGDAAYHSKWYNADTNLRKHLILIIMRSQKPLFLETGAFNVLSFSLFVSVMKMSYSILALLR